MAYSKEEIFNSVQKADAAGDTETARMLMNEYRKVEQEEQRIAEQPAIDADIASTEKEAESFGQPQAPVNQLEQDAYKFSDAFNSKSQVDQITELYPRKTIGGSSAMMGAMPSRQETDAEYQKRLSHLPEGEIENSLAKHKNELATQAERYIDKTLNPTTLGEDLENAVRGIQKRSKNLAGSTVLGVDTLMSSGEKDGTYMGDDSALKIGAEMWQDTTQGFESRNTWADVKDTAERKGWYHPDTIGDFFMFSAEVAPQSAVDMAGIAGTPGAYFTSRTHQSATERAKNNGRDKATASDMAKAAPAVIVELAADRFALGKLTQAQKQVLGPILIKHTMMQTAKRAGKAIPKGMATEGSTEAFQGFTQNVGETLGTDKGFNFDEALTQGIEEGMASLLLGGGLKGASQVSSDLAENKQVDVDKTQRREAELKEGQAKVEAEQVKAFREEAKAQADKTPVAKEADILAEGKPSEKTKGGPVSEFVEKQADKEKKGGFADSKGSLHSFVDSNDKGYNEDQLQKAIKEVATDLRSIAHGVRMENTYASHVTEKKKKAILEKSLKYADDLEGGKKDISALGLYQRINEKLTGERVATLPKTPTKGDKSSKVITEPTPKSSTSTMKSSTPVAGSPYKTGDKITVPFIHNPESSKKHAPQGMDFGQNLEPAGKWMSIDKKEGLLNPLPGWQKGEVTFNNPIVLEHKDTRSTGWKKDLSDMFGGKKKKALTNAIKKAGYDGIVTVYKTKNGWEFNESVSIGATESTPKLDAKPIVKEDLKAKPTVDRRILDAHKAGDKKKVAELKTYKQDSKNRGVFKSQLPTTSTKEFKNWFGDSKVVDMDGQPKVVFHGTNSDFTEFKSSSAQGWGRGVYFTTSKTDTKDFGEKTIPTYLSIKNPFNGDMSTLSDKDVNALNIVKDRASLFEKKYDDEYDWTEDFAEDGSFANDIIRGLGYDGIITEESNSIEGGEIVAFEPTQIKSTENRGTFDPKDPNIFKSEKAGKAGSQYIDPLVSKGFPVKEVGDKIQVGSNETIKLTDKPTSARDVRDSAGKISKSLNYYGTNAIIRHGEGIYNSVGEYTQTAEKNTSSAVEIQAHELFHWIDERKVYGDKLLNFSKGVSGLFTYNINAPVQENGAEFFRAYMTNAPELMANSPQAI